MIQQRKYDKISNCKQINFDIKTSDYKIRVCNLVYMKNLDIHIGEIITDVMKTQNVTKAELARRLDVKPQSVDYLLGRSSIDTNTLYNVSVALDYDFAKLYLLKQDQINSDKSNFDFVPKKAKVLVEVELNTEDVIKLNLKERIVQILNK